VPSIVTAVAVGKSRLPLLTVLREIYPFTVKRWAAAAIPFLAWLINGAHDHLVGSRTAVDLR
jgi:hypothetical protein